MILGLIKTMCFIIVLPNYSSSYSSLLIQDFKHSNHLIIYILSLFLRSIIMIFALEKALLGSVDITGINKISRATLAKLG